MKKKKIILLLFVICLVLFGSIYHYISFKNNNIKTKNNSTDNTIINKENKIDDSNVVNEEHNVSESVNNDIKENTENTQKDTPTTNKKEEESINNNSNKKDEKKQEVSNNDNKNTTSKSPTKSAWEELGMSEYDYYNKPVFTWATITHSVKDYSNPLEACQKDGEKSKEKALSENSGVGVMYSCHHLYSHSGNYLGEMLEVEYIN